MPFISGGGGGGGTVSPPVTLTGTNPATTPLTVIGAAAQAGFLFRTEDVTSGSGIEHSASIGVSVLNAGDWTLGGGPYLEAREGDGAAPNGNWIFQAHKSGGSQVRVQNPGHMVFDAHAAPAAGNISAGECALWFDQTNGASKLMVFAKQADGTVKTASIALA